MKERIKGREAVHAMEESSRRGPIRLQAPRETDPPAPNTEVVPTNPGPQGLNAAGAARRAPPRVRKPMPRNDTCVAPTPDLEAHRARLREAFGDTMSDEFVDFALGKLVESLRPSPYDSLEEATLNAGLALVDSLEPKSEFDAYLAIQIIALGFSGLRFLRMSHGHATEEYINVWGGHGLKLFKRETELIRAYDHHRRGHSQTVEVRHVHIYPGAQGVVGIVNTGSKGAIDHGTEVPAAGANAGPADPQSLPPASAVDDQAAPAVDPVMASKRTE